MMRLSRFARVATLAVSPLAVLAALARVVARAQEKSTPIEQDRAAQPRAGKQGNPARAASASTIVKLPNGLTVILIEDHKLPTVTFTMWIRPGQLGDPGDLPGLASFTADMLREGTARRTSSQIAAEADSLGATLNANSAFGASYTAMNASGLIGDAEHILDLMSDIVLHPAFPPDELAQYKRREEAALEQRLSNPGFLAQQAMRRVLYVEGPLSVSAPTKESVEKVTPEDLKKFHDQHYRPGNTLFGVIGDFRTEDMRALVDKHFGAWAGAAEAPVALPKWRPRRRQRSRWWIAPVRCRPSCSRPTGRFRAPIPTTTRSR